MPVRRQADGKVVEQPTRLVRKPGKKASPDARATAPTELSGKRGASPPAEEHTRLIRRSRPGRPGGSGAEDLMEDPPVGWLVVVKGHGRGRVLQLGYGMNTIGRGPEARVRLDFGDATIARANHARVVYEPRERRYFLSHGDGSNLTYLDGELVIGSRPLATGSTVEVGATSLRFHAFCSAEFDWSDTDD